ncbi:hypothetical protein BGZ92_006225, partial [Podila epicladia]
MYTGIITTPDGINTLYMYKDLESTEWLTFNKRGISSAFVVKTYDDGKATIAIRTNSGTFREKNRYITWNNTHRYFSLYDDEYFLDYKDFGDDKIKFGLEGNYLQLDISSPAHPGI